MRILQIEADAIAAKKVESILRSKAIDVYGTNLGEEGVDLATLYDYHLILLALDLPDIGGYEVLKQIRNKGVRTPVLIVNRNTGVEAEVHGLNLGADDYLQRPFHPDVLVARIHAVVRRSMRQASSTIAVGNLIVDHLTHQVRVAGVIIKITKMEYKLLSSLLLRKGHVLTRKVLLDHLYDSADTRSERNVDVFVGRLRKKLAERKNCTAIIQTVHSIGYILEEQSV